MSLIYVFSASPMEAQPVRKLVTPSASGTPSRCGSNDIVVAVSGMGPRNASRTAREVLQEAGEASPSSKPDAVLVIGLCGGLTASLVEGQIVAYSECRSTDAPASLLACSDRILDAIVDRLESSAVSCERVVGLTSARIATIRSERLALVDSGAHVVDMESYPIIEAASAAGIPSAVLRVVADSLDRELPDFNRALDDGGGLDGRKALKVALGAPVRTMQLLGANRRAMRQMARALEVALKSSCFV